MKILITGGAGFVGTNVAEHFSSKGWAVTLFDNFTRETAKRNLSHIKSKMPQAQVISGDIRNAASVEEAAKGKDFIVHLAAQVAVTTSVTDPRTDFEINAFGTFNALEAARRNNCGLIYTSTNKVYGDNVNRIPVEEHETRYDFANELKGKGVPETFSIDAPEHSPYGCSKLAGDVYVRDYAHVYGIPTVVNRMSCIYGLNQYGTEDQGWIAHFIISALKKKPLTIYGDGKQVRDALFGTDLARLFAAEIEQSSKAGGNVFNVGGGYKNTISLIELLDSIKRLGSPTTTTRSDWRPADQKVFYTDISKVTRMLGWKPEVGVQDGIRMLYEWAKKTV